MMEWSDTITEAMDTDTAPLVSAISLDKQPHKSSIRSDASCDGHAKRVAFGGDAAEIAEHDPECTPVPRHGEHSRRHSLEEIRHKTIEVPVKVVVNTFYAKIIKHPRLSKFFDAIDMGTLMRKQEAVMTYAFGGPELAREMNATVDVQAIHAKAIREKGVTPQDFDDFVGMFEDTLIELDIPEETRVHAVAAIRSFREHFTPPGAA